MSILNDLVNKIEDISLRERISEEIDRLTKQKKFGLVFEEHLPECTPLYDIPVKVGALVALKTGKVNDVYKVLSIEDTVAECLHRESKEIIRITIEELVSVAEFGEPIYPYLKPVDSICNAPDSDLWHTLIEADNYHALQLLEYLYAGKVDCIYIDPPYNTGAKDWKYNNNYVDASDAYRHSKWLSFMQKRLRIAKKLLNSKNSILIVAIDENELHHLSILLQELFPNCKVQMVSVVSNFAGASIIDQFNRVDEQLLFVQIGNARPLLTKVDTTPSSEDEKSKTSSSSVRWEKFLRSGGNSRRQDTKSKFFPVFIDEVKGEIVGCGEHLPLELPITSSVLKPKGCIEQWPISQRGTEACWQLSAPTFREYLKAGRIKLGKKNSKTGTYAISFLTKGHMAAIERGELIVEGKDECGTLILRNACDVQPLKKGKTIWTRKDYFAREYGSNLIRDMLPGRIFPFPKSVYAVRDALRYYVQDKPNALIVDFFAGSGTTLHAVNILNAEDDGKRRCIMVTNNEIGVEERKKFDSLNIQPGSEEWESHGIARYITWPRTVCSILGKDINGNRLKGSYIGSEAPMSDGFQTNAAFFKLSFLDKNDVALGRQFRELMPVLWMKAGAMGPCPVIVDEAIPNMMVLPNNRFAVLLDERFYMDFILELDKHPEIKTIYIVTDSEAGYKDMIVGLEDKNTYQLYRDYLDNFRINSVRR